MKKEVKKETKTLEEKTSDLESSVEVSESLQAAVDFIGEEKSKSGPTRVSYSEETKAKVQELYPLCKTPEDRQKLADALGVKSTSRLYNLASRLSNRPKRR